jgi:hypothetical protein
MSVLRRQGDDEARRLVPALRSPDALSSLLSQVSAGEGVTALTQFQEALVDVKQSLATSKACLTEREWTTLMDILARFAAYELGEDKEIA